MKTIIRISLVALLLTACGCTKDALNELPPATQTGADTFGCKINGVVYKCSGKWDPKSFLSLQGIYYYQRQDYVHITAYIYEPEESIFLNFNFDSNTGLYTEGITVNSGTVVPDSNSHIHITTYNSNVISGTFQMEIVFEDGEIWHITEGRFDIKRNN